MIEYATNDALFLPIIYQIILDNMIFYTNLSMYAIFKECEKILSSSRINLLVKNFNKHNLKKGQEIEGMLKYLFSF